MANEVRSQRLMQFLQVASNPALAPFAKFNYILPEFAEFLLNFDQTFSGFSQNAAIFTFSIFQGYFAQVKFVSSNFRLSS